MSSTRKAYVLNGPNLNMLGKREPHLYGDVTLDQVENRCSEVAQELGFDLFFGQSNYEGQLIDWLHQAREEKAGVVINPAGLSFRSIPLVDALKIIEQPIIECHVTNIHSRTEEVYHTSWVSPIATGVIAGVGTYGYELALLALRRELDGKHA
ncbi:type II 3-dehydroquinate dehydratase [Corynebacterium glyciniphilum]|uniref:type II 3-dehydroquinate dehydratase n=1 Tax=Corynebacterium glyciniphilum TaxID=1404244 RepID=UPI0011AB39BE|nr:type II 3-dehydroquinate dehydratase [Corynebacterium glyciniphilum]